MPEFIIYYIKSPAYFYSITCGLIIKHEQLFKNAVDFKAELIPKKQSNSLFALFSQSLPCKEFLVTSYP